METKRRVHGRKITYIWSDAVIDNIARKVAEEPMEDELDKWMIGESEHGHMPLVKKPQYVIGE